MVSSVGGAKVAGSITGALFILQFPYAVNDCYEATSVGAVTVQARLRRSWYLKLMLNRSASWCSLTALR